MKNFNVLVTTLTLCAFFIFTHCTEDPTGPTGPTISFLSGSGVISGNASVVAGTPIKIIVKGDKRENPLKSITIKKDGVSLAPLSFIMNGTDALSNPALIIGTDKDGFTYTYEFAGATNIDTVTYEFTLTDDNNASAIEQITILFTGTTITEITGVVVYNTSSPAGYYGSVNLNAGIPVAQGSVSAHLEDLGNSFNSTIWLMRLFGVNGSQLRSAGVGFDFSSLETIEAIASAFDQGIDLPNNDSGQLIIGSYFLVKQNNDYFAVKITNMVVTTNDNLDYYELSIKN
jgi:hypothetical protein